MYRHQKNIKTQGKPLSETRKALIMLHGRGASAQSILALAPEFGASDFTLFAPQATNNSWYPYGFMAPVSENQPALDSALEMLAELLEEIKSQGVESKDIYLLGFSQGACLTAEFATRNAQRFGGLLIFTGGLIGQRLDLENYQGNFSGTPVFISTGDPDAHVPVSRVDETVGIMEEKGALVIRKIYKNRPHTIGQEELALGREMLKGKG